MNSGAHEAGRRELHLHVGLPKTGTTYLQKCLALNHDAFVAEGLAFGPMQDTNGAHHALAWIARDQGAEAMAEILAAAAGDRLLVSSEVFSDVLAQPGRAAELHRALAPRFDVTLHVTLRRQDFMKESAYAEVAKNLRRLGPLRVAPDPALAGRVLLFDDPDLDRRLELMEDVFGREAVRVSIYRDERREDPLMRLRRSLGLPSLDAPRRPERESNTSLPRRKTLALAAFAKDDAELVALALETVRLTRRIATDKPKFLLSPAERRAVVERYLEGNRRILERHAPEDGDWLLELPADDPDWFPAASLRSTEFLALGVALVRRALRDPKHPMLERLRLAAAGATHVLDAARFTRRDRGHR